MSAKFEKMQESIKRFFEYKYNIILLGMPAAGKTTMAKTYLKGKKLSAEEQPKEQTEWEELKKVFPLLTVPKVSIVDTGGLEKNQNQEVYGSWISKAEKVLFVFNGIDFLKEIQSPQLGGVINSKITGLVYNNLKDRHKVKKEKEGDGFFFIATHADQYSNLKRDIINEMEKANKDYERFFGGARRYPYKQFFSGDHFFCIDSRNPDEVKEMFTKIIKYNLQYEE